MCMCLESLKTGPNSFIMDKIHTVFFPKMFKSKVEQETKE